MAGLAGLAFLPSIRQNPTQFVSLLGASGLLCAWTLVLRLLRRPFPRVEVVLRKQHYLQACIQGSLMFYWGWYWPPVYDHAPLILAQLLFAYAFDLLLGWSRRDHYALSFAPFPVIFSINLFLWFKPEWFYLQFAMVALGMAAKEFIRWEKDGRPAHIFNPSSFPLAIVSVILLATGSTGITWGQEIATTQFFPPHIYLVLFLAGLPGQFLFGVTTMTMSAVVTTVLFGHAYFALTGIYFFYDSFIPVSVFLGMHLLFTDPATAPRTELGRIFYGVIYALSTIGLYQLLGSAGLPTFYDKLLQVPFMNLAVRRIDGLAGSAFTLGRALFPRQRNLAYMSMWAAVFSVLSATQTVGDDHPGQWVGFWRQACQEGRAYACPYAADLHQTFCDHGSAWACNEAGLLYVALSRSGEDSRRLDPAGAAPPFRRGCELGFEAACRNLSALAAGSEDFTPAAPTSADIAILSRGSKARADVVR